MVELRESLRTTDPTGKTARSATGATRGRECLKAALTDVSGSWGKVCRPAGIGLSADLRSIADLCKTSQTYIKLRNQGTFLPVEHSAKTQDLSRHSAV